MTIHRINPGTRWSDITVFNGIAHFVEVADSDTSADMQGQVEQVSRASRASIGEDWQRSFAYFIGDDLYHRLCGAPSA